MDEYIPANDKNLGCTLLLIGSCCIFFYVAANVAWNRTEDKLLPYIELEPETPTDTNATIPTANTRDE